MVLNRRCMPYGAAAISCACVARRSGYSGASAPSNASHACLACSVRPVSVCAGRSRSRALLPVAEQSRWHRHLPTDPSRTWLGAAQWATVSRPQLHSAGRSRGTPWRSARNRAVESDLAASARPNDRLQAGLMIRGTGLVYRADSIGVVLRSSRSRPLPQKAGSTSSLPVQDQPAIDAALERLTAND